MAMTDTVKKNDHICLIDAHTKKYLLSTDDVIQKFKGIGVLDPTILIGKTYGTQITIGNKQFWLLRPSSLDKAQAIKRKAQIILPRDAAHIIINCAIEPGQTILEAGIGSGSLTIILANILGTHGTIISYDNRQEFIEHAQKNIDQAHLTHIVIAKYQDVTQGITETNLDAIILDIPNPWDAIEHAWQALKIGGYFCAYSPLISQVEHTVNKLHQHPFIEIISREHIQRDLVISPQGTRPSFKMLGHTGYLTFARKVQHTTENEKNL
jgi:tRNA (adenine57-N1/adenine58-N1)-methyltransferase